MPWTKSRFGILFFALALPIYSSEDWGKSIQRGLELAKKENRFLMVDVYADWCTYCLVLEKEIFPEPVVKKAIQNFIKVRIDGEEFPNLKNRYQVEGYPTILILDGDGNYVTKITGLATKEDIIKTANRIQEEPNLESYLKTELRKRPNAPDLYFRLGLLYHQKVEKTKAIQAYQEGEKTSKPYPLLREDILYHLGLALWQNEQFAEAKQTFSQSLNEFPNSQKKVTIKLFLGLTLAETGEKSLAKKTLLEIQPQLKSNEEKKLCEDALTKLK